MTADAWCVWLLDDPGPSWRCGTGTADVWGCLRPHADLVRERAARNGCTENEALDHIIDTVTEALGIGRSTP